MANKAKEFKMEKDPNFDYIIEEQGQTSINLRKIKWGDNPYKLDLRKWSYQKPEEERALKGISLTDNGANELAGVLVETGYGDTKRIKEAIEKRKDYNSKPSDSENTVDESVDEDNNIYYDPSELFGG